MEQSLDKGAALAGPIDLGDLNVNWDSALHRPVESAGDFYDVVE